MMELKQVIVIRKDLRLSCGKMCGQSAHASLEALEKMKRENSEWVEEWINLGQAKVVLQVGSEKELLEIFEKIKRKFPCALIKDAGLTQTKQGTITAIAVGPAPEIELDKITGHLKLL
ncbi:MAG: peptidyl-tRNA hydrolase Pth2 [archaeon]|nr:peptidyl-tRNA hydrolase Pth2 [archaeon]